METPIKRIGHYPDGSSDDDDSAFDFDLDAILGFDAFSDDEPDKDTPKK
ncbi:MAG: hypothetical protein ACI4MJ_05910 [Aristaeellaceae bacterium]